jgi:hypothetical protein
MTIRTTTRTVSFHRAFRLKGVDRLLPPGDYRVVTDEELIVGLSFAAYHRIATAIFVPAPSGSAIEMVTVHPADLQLAQEQDAAAHLGGAAEGA